MVLLTPAVAVFFVAGIERRYFYLTLALAAVLAVGFIWQKPARIIRVTSYFGLTEQKIQSDPRLHWLAKRLEETALPATPNISSARPSWRSGAAA